MTGPDYCTGGWDRLSFAGSEHEAILQTLERKSNGLYLPLDAYQPTIEEWAGVPLIYAQDHPNPEAYDADPAAELARIKGRLVGQCNDAWIDKIGHPKLRGMLDIRDDEVQAGIENGEISLSTGLRNVRPKSERLDEPARPHHILLFREGGRTQPGDKGAFILNTDAGKDPIAWLKALFAEWRKESASGDGTGDRDMAEAKELEAKLANKEQELADAKLAFTQLQTKMAEMGEAVKAKDVEIAGLKKDNLAFIAKEKDAKWDAFKAKRIPPGMIAGEKEKDARKEFEADPLTFMDKIMEFREKNPESSEEEGDVGVQFTSQKGKPKEEKYEDQLRKVGVPCISVMEGKGEH